MLAAAGLGLLAACIGARPGPKCRMRKILGEAQTFAYILLSVTPNLCRRRQDCGDPQLPGGEARARGEDAAGSVAERSPQGPRAGLCCGCCYGRLLKAKGKGAWSGWGLHQCGPVGGQWGCRSCCCCSCCCANGCEGGHMRVWSTGSWCLWLRCCWPSWLCTRPAHGAAGSRLHAHALLLCVELHGFARLQGRAATNGATCGCQPTPGSASSSEAQVLLCVIQQRLAPSPSRPTLPHPAAFSATPLPTQHITNLTSPSYLLSPPAGVKVERSAAVKDELILTGNDIELVSRSTSLIRQVSALRLWRRSAARA